MVACPTCDGRGTSICLTCDGRGNEDCTGCRGASTIVCPSCAGLGLLSPEQYVQLEMEVERADLQGRVTKERPREDNWSRPSAATLVLSLVLPGLGQLFRGEVEKGILYLLIAFTLVIGISNLDWIGRLLCVAFWTYSALDAYMAAKRIN